jgi:seryl-tRNA synthetase
MDRETETVINKLMSDLKAVKDLSAYLAANNKKLREALQKIADIEHEDIPSPKTPTEGIMWTVLAMAVGLAEDALKEGE